MQARSAWSLVNGRVRLSSGVAGFGGGVGGSAPRQRWRVCRVSLTRIPRGNIIVVSRSVMSHDSSAGVEANTGGTLSVDNTEIGVEANGGIVLAHSDLQFNTRGISGTAVSYGNNRIAGNSSPGTPPTVVPQQSRGRRRRKLTNRCATNAQRRRPSASRSSRLFDRSATPPAYSAAVAENCACAVAAAGDR
jgi:hypothetical protein